MAVIFVMMTGITMGVAVYEQQDYAEYTSKSQPIGELNGDMTIEIIGDTYEGNADADYTYYRINVPIFNSGTQAYHPQFDLAMEVTGADYDEVQDYYDSGDTTYLSDEDTMIIPAGQTGVATYIVQIKKGVSEVNAIYYDNWDDSYEEINGKSQILQVPTQI